MNILIVSNKKYSLKRMKYLTEELKINIYYIENKADLKYENLKKINPKYVFFPYWSYIIPKEVYQNFNCIIFHMTDLPFGRGGSPLQNLISRGIYSTKISAIQCEKEIDSGAIFLKKEMSLYGNAEEIYLRAYNLIEEMIIEMIKEEIIPVKQSGEVVVFKRRTPEDSDISSLDNLEKIYDYIRMLDAEGYPKAYIKNDKFKFEFERAALKNGYIQADVKIYQMEGKNE